MPPFFEQIVYAEREAPFETAEPLPNIMCDVIRWGLMAVVWAGSGCPTIWLLVVCYCGYWTKREISELRGQLLETRKLAVRLGDEQLRGHLLETRKLVWRLENDYERRLYDLESCAAFPPAGECWRARLNRVHVVAAAGRFDVIKRLRDPRTGDIHPWSAWTFSRAATSGNLEMLKWMCDSDTDDIVSWNWEMFDCVIASGNFEMVIWAYQFIETRPGLCLHQGASTGNIKIMEWLLAWDTDRNMRWTSIACVEAVHSKNPIEALEWLRGLNNNGGGVCPWDSSVCATALASDNPIPILKWLRDPNTGGGVCPWVGAELKNFLLKGGKFELQGGGIQGMKRQRGRTPDERERDLRVATWLFADSSYIDLLEEYNDDAVSHI